MSLRANTETNITAMLNAWNVGDVDSRERLASIIYGELNRLAHLRMFGERPGHMLNTSALVNEAFVRFMESSPREWQDRVHFFAFMSRVMRQVLVDLARYHKAAKRNEGGQHSDIAAAENVPARQNFHIFLDLDRALTELAQLYERQARVVELRYFGGLENTEIAEVLSVSEDTVLRDWRIARGWLYQRLNTPTPS
jgi:RNA polymerase sigma factor (TIGR02999 family)